MRKLLYSITLILAISPLNFSYAKNSWPDMSIFHLKGTWTNQNGEKVTIKDFAGKPSVIAMVYTSCQHTCPLITSEVIRIREKLPKKMRSKVTYSLISFDPEGDTPRVLKKYKKKRKLNDDWTLLTSNDSLARQLAGVLGVNYKKTGDGGFSHSNIITLIDKNGVVVEQIKTLNASNKPMVKKIKSLLK